MQSIKAKDNKWTVTFENLSLRQMYDLTKYFNSKIIDLNDEVEDEKATEVDTPTENLAAVGTAPIPMSYWNTLKAQVNQQQLPPQTAPAPTAKAEYTLSQIQNAAAQFSQANRAVNMQKLATINQQLGLTSLAEIKEDQFAEYARLLREVGGVI